MTRISGHLFGFDSILSMEKVNLFISEYYYVELIIFDGYRKLFHSRSRYKTIDNVMNAYNNLEKEYLFYYDKKTNSYYMYKKSAQICDMV
jgi:hypothetical protein